MGLRRIEAFLHIEAFPDFPVIYANKNTLPLLRPVFSLLNAVDTTRKAF